MEMAHQRSKTEGAVALVHAAKIFEGCAATANDTDYRVQALDLSSQMFEEAGDVVRYGPRATAYYDAALWELEKVRRWHLPRSFGVDQYEARDRLRKKIDHSKLPQYLTPHYLD